MVYNLVGLLQAAGGLSIAEGLKAAATEVLQESGVVYDEASGMYYDAASGYYVNPVSVIVCYYELSFKYVVQLCFSP